MTEQSEDQEEQGQSKYSITRMYPAALQHCWPLVKQALALFSPPDVVVDHETLVNYLQAIMAGRMELWGIRRDEQVIGMIFTTVVEDTLAGQKSLLIYGAASFEPSPLRVWSTAIRDLRAYARKQDCTHIIANSSVKSIIEFMDRLGASTNQRMLVLEV